MGSDNLAAVKMIKVIACALLIALVLGACGDDDAPSNAGGGAEAPDEVTGVITAIEAHKGKHVTAFTLESDEGETYDISIAADVDYGFELTHLIEHRDEELPVSVSLEERSGTLYALTIDDA
jgi:hypothetical protein